MSVYATIDDVQKRMPQFELTATSKPTRATAQELLDSTEAQYESAMANLGYCIPITGKNGSGGTRALAQSKEMVCLGAIAKILFARAAALGTEAAWQTAEKAQQRYDDMLTQLADPNSPIELQDACRTDDAMEKSGEGSSAGAMLGNFNGVCCCSSCGCSPCACRPRFTMCTPF